MGKLKAFFSKIFSGKKKEKPKPVMVLWFRPGMRHYELNLDNHIMREVGEQEFRYKKFGRKGYPILHDRLYAVAINQKNAEQKFIKLITELYGLEKADRSGRTDPKK